MRTTLLISLPLLSIAAAWIAWISWYRHQQAIGRLSPAIEDPARDVGTRRSERGLAAWLRRAGYVGPRAWDTFVGATAVGAALGVVIALLFGLPSVQAWFAVGLTNVPAGLRDTLLTAARFGPWFLVALLGSIPLLVVRARRRERVRLVEEDLPITLELLATLAEAGLGFDAALIKILRTAKGERPLTSELRRFQQEQLAGVPRVQALRNIARRLDVGSMTVFVSAVVQADQVGASLTETLRRQAEDLRDRRRQRALTLAQSLPVKLVFPLVICFLPGVFVSVLGPALYQMAQLAIGTVRGAP